MATHSSIYAWKIPWTKEPGGLHTVHGVAKSRTRLSDFTFPSFWSWLGLASGSSGGHNRGEGIFSLAPSWVWSACPALRRSQLTGGLTHVLPASILRTAPSTSLQELAPFRAQVLPRTAWSFCPHFSKASLN